MTGTAWDVVHVARVTDGDTVRLVRSRYVDIDGREYLLSDADAKGIAIRLVWVDTPEKGNHPGWENARRDLIEWIDDRPELTVVCYESGGWDRIMGDLIDADGNSASQWMMIERGWPPYVGAAS